MRGPLRPALGRPLRVEEVFKGPVGDSILSEYSDKHFLPTYRWVLTGNTYEPSRSPDDGFFDQAENRLHVQKAIMAALAGQD